MKTIGLTRRQFLRRTSAAAAGISAVLAGGRARAVPERVGANEKIVLGFIGCRNMGGSHYQRFLANDQVQIAAVADVDATVRGERVKNAADKGVKVDAYGDFRELAARKDIDAVVVATPDHWHALAAIAAMKAGKDVYCEKPLALTIAEGRAMERTARRYARVIQIGTQQRSDWWFRHACEVVRNGRIGEVKKAVCFFGSNPHCGWIPDEDPPPHLDWNMWLGPAPWRRYNQKIHPYEWRYFRDSSGGLLTDWGVHLLDIAQWGLGKDGTSPVRVEARGEMYEDNMYEFPRTMRIEYDYGDCVLVWSQGENIEFEPGQGYGTKFYGTEADLCVNRGGYWVHPKGGNTIDEKLGPDDLHLYASPGHHQDWLDCIRTRRKPICDVEVTHRATALSHLGNISFWLGRPLQYDPINETFPVDPAAQRLIEKPMRAPWHL